MGWCVPIQVAGLGAGVSFCCAYLELSIPHVHRGNTELEKSSSASPAVSAYSDTQVSLTPWKGGRHGPGFKLVLCTVAKPMEYLCCLCRLLSCF